MSAGNPTHIIADGMREVATSGRNDVPGTREDGQLWGAFPNTMTLTDLAAHVVAKLTDAGYSIVKSADGRSCGIEGHAPAGTRDGLNACACGVAFSSTWEEHVSREIRGSVERSTMVDTCEHCGDLVITHDGQNWAHYRGPGRRLNRCQHTVPYGFDASPAHGGEYDSLTRVAAEGEKA